MCLIVDANRYGDYMERKNAGIKLIQEWVEGGKVKIAYSYLGTLGEELSKVKRMDTMLTNLSRAGKARLVVDSKLNDLMVALKPLEPLERKRKGKGKPVEYGQHYVEELLSDDSHVIALALAANVKLLVSEDRPLGKDFTDKRKLGGKVCRVKEYDEASKSNIKNIKKKHIALLKEAQCNTAPCGLG